VVTHSWRVSTHDFSSICTPGIVIAFDDILAFNFL
jgi:hypothetical protein